MAERGGFEPPVQLLTVQRFSKPPPSATRPSLRLASNLPNDITPVKKHFHDVATVQHKAPKSIRLLTVSFLDPAIVFLQRLHLARPHRHLTKSGLQKVRVHQPRDFVYARLRRCAESEPTGYAPDALDSWAERFREHSAQQGHDCFVYFITIHNDTEEPVTIKGRKWVVTNDEGEITAVETFDGRMCVWQRASDMAVAKLSIQANTPTTALITRTVSSVVLFRTNRLRQ